MLKSIKIVTEEKDNKPSQIKLGHGIMIINKEY